MRNLAWAALLLGVMAACGGGAAPLPDTNPNNNDASASSSSGGAPNNSSSGGGGGSSGGGNPSASSSSSGEPAPFTLTEASLQSGGRQHDYLVVTPSDRAAEKLPIVFVYHGTGGNGPNLQRGMRFEEVSGGGAIVVYPTSNAGNWDVNNLSSGNVYLAAFDAMVERVANDFDGDRRKVSVLGWSNGAFFAQLLGCWRSSSLHAIGSMAGGYPIDINDYPPENVVNYTATGSAWPPNSFGKCEGQTKQAAMVIQGTNDGVGTAYSAAYWAYVNDCWTDPNNCNFNPNPPKTPTSRPPCVSFDNAPADAPVHLCEIQGMGHSIWDQTAPAFWEFVQAVP